VLIIIHEVLFEQYEAI